MSGNRPLCASISVARLQIRVSRKLPLCPHDEHVSDWVVCGGYRIMEVEAAMAYERSPPIASAAE